MYITNEHVDRLAEFLCEDITSAGTQDVGSTIAEALPLTKETLLKDIHLVGREIDQISRKLAIRLQLDESSAMGEIGRLLRRLPCNDRFEHRPIEGYSIENLAEDLWYRVVLVITQSRVNIPALIK